MIALAANEFHEIAEQASGGAFNEVSAWVTPNGQLVIHLSHRNTSDYDVLVRVKSEHDVILTREVLDRNPNAWEDDNELLGRLNHGQDWSWPTPPFSEEQAK